MKSELYYVKISIREIGEWGGEKVEEVHLDQNRIQWLLF
jgi:hypothetical protein